MPENLTSLYRLCDELAKSCLDYKTAKENKTAHGTLAAKAKLSRAQDLADALSTHWTSQMPPHWNLKKGRFFVMQSKDEIKFALAPTRKGLIIPTQAKDIFCAMLMGLNTLERATQDITTEEKKKRRLLPKAPLPILVKEAPQNSERHIKEVIYKVKAQNGHDALAQLFFQGNILSVLRAPHYIPCTERETHDVILWAKNKSSDFFMDTKYSVSYSAAYWETACKDARFKTLLKSNHLKQNIDWEKGFQRRDHFKDAPFKSLFKKMSQLSAPGPIKQFLVSFNPHTGDIVRAWDKDSAFVVKDTLTIFPRGSFGGTQTPSAWEISTI